MAVGRYWKEFADRNIAERIVPAPENLIDYTTELNKHFGLTEAPTPVEPNEALKEDILNAIMEMPNVVRAHFDKYVIGIFLVKGLSTTAAVKVYSNYHNVNKGFVILNVDAIDKLANDWVSWKANNPFPKVDGHHIKIIIEKSSENTRKNTIQYVLIHEIGHLVFAAQSRKNAFISLSWTMKKRSILGKFDDVFNLRKNVKYYRLMNTVLNTSRISETYSQWEQTNYVSLYGSTNFHEDFAEAYATYVHVILQRKPWLIQIYDHSKLIKEFNTPIKADRCREKKEYFDSFFAPTA